MDGLKPVWQEVRLERAVGGADLDINRGGDSRKCRMPSFAGPGVGCPSRLAVDELAWAGRRGVQLRVLGVGIRAPRLRSAQLKGAGEGELSTEFVWLLQDL